MRKLRFFLLGMACGLLGACSPTYTPTTVDIPVEVPCRPPAINPPQFPLQTTPVSAPIDTKVKAALSELYVRRIYEDQLTASIKACGG